MHSDQIRTRELFIVVGGTGGIGRAIVKKAPDATQVVIVSRTRPEALPSDIIHIESDLSVPSGTLQALSHIQNMGAPIRALVNCAGHIYAREDILSLDHATFERSLELHALPTIFIARGLSSQLLRSESPSVVNIGSIYGDVIDNDVVAYATSKSIVPMLTQMLAKSLAPSVTANCILPGHIDTDMTRSAPADFVSSIVARTPSGRLGSPEEVADLTDFLISKKARFITGAAFRIDGGFWGVRD